MKREIVKIIREKCTGCGLCIPNCHEGALQIIDNKAVLISDLMCDGLGACLGHCPEGALEIEEREAEEYQEQTVIKEMIKNGKNVVIAHLQHLKEHNEINYYNQGVEYLKDNQSNIQFSVTEVLDILNNNDMENHIENKHCGCPGAQERVIIKQEVKEEASIPSLQISELRQWPVQLHLINPRSNIFTGKDLLVAADCVAFAVGNFHQQFLKNKALVIACPKLDDGKDVYLQKFIALIDEAKVNTIVVVRMEVPCCSGLTGLVKLAQQQAKRKVPLKEIIISIDGKNINEEWI